MIYCIIFFTRSSISVIVFFFFHSSLDPWSSIIDPRSPILDPRSSILDPRYWFSRKPWSTAWFFELFNVPSAVNHHAMRNVHSPRFQMTYLTYKIGGDVVNGRKNYFHESVSTGEFMNFPCPAVTQRAKHSTSYKLFLRWFPCFALRILTAHDFCVISTRKWARARTKGKRFSSN